MQNYEQIPNFEIFTEFCTDDTDLSKKKSPFLRRTFQVFFIVSIV
jgi:hypothetical protein